MRKPGLVKALNIGLAVVSVVALALVLLAPIHAQAAAAFVPGRAVSEQYKEIMGRNGLMIFLTIILNIYGTLLLVGGAIYSGYLFWRKRVLINRVAANILIAAGGMLPAMAGSFVQAGLLDWLYLSELLGVILMFLGFWQATVNKPVPQAQPAPAASGD